MPRSSYPEGRAGYLRWRRDQKQRHAAELRELLESAGVDQAVVARASAIVAKVGLGSDPEVQVFEDAVCLTFLETQLSETADRLDEAHMTNVIAKTLTKMSEPGKAAALTIDLDARGAGRCLPAPWRCTRRRADHQRLISAACGATGDELPTTPAGIGSRSATTTS